MSCPGQVEAALRWAEAFQNAPDAAVVQLESDYRTGVSDEVPARRNAQQWAAASLGGDDCVISWQRGIEFWSAGGPGARFLATYANGSGSVDTLRRVTTLPVAGVPVWVWVAAAFVLYKLTRG